MADNTKNLLKAKQALYLAARNLVVPAFKDDVEEIKALRDMHCMDMMGKPYNMLTLEEMYVVIDVMNMIAKGGNITKCTVSQRRLLSFYQFNYALAYADWDNAIFRSDENKNLTGLNLKIYVTKKIEHKQKIDPAIYRYMYESYINPKSHEFLLEGSYKSMVRNKKIFHYEYLTPQEANYLIQRFGQMYVQLNASNKLKTVEFVGSLN